ncbi:hypothetical protein [Paenibacillus sp. UNC499MF]|uniref:hypothetical protein n=1 Tax=Paenibacillus sp. UNC499MF TaxID=1502751 RepID=UPI0015E1F0CA|nr:hypothetical protein [Paenibacillus sp. UNC499MF]
MRSRQYQLFAAREEETEQAGLADAAPAKPTAPFTPDTSRRSPAVIPAARLPHDDL